MWVQLGLWLLMVWGSVGRHREVVTSQGRVRGYLSMPSAHSPMYYAYLGLPYAQPPVKGNRYKAPQPPPSWDGIFEASHRIKCPQPEANGQEDCLVVNVFVPEFIRELRPVVVIVHGGNFNQGWGAFEPPDAFLEEGFIVVTFNYRLGALGFLCLGVEEIPGNAGLKDIVAALYWIHRNIKSFGGNVYEVTVYAVEAGAAAIQILILLGLTEGLIQNAMLESGSILSPVMMNYDPLTTAHSVARSYGFDGEDFEDLILFYRTATVQLLTKASESRSFVPSVENGQYENSLLDDDPMAIYSRKRRHDLPMIIVYTDEMSYIPQTLDLDKFKMVPTHFEPLLPNNLIFDDPRTEHRIAESVKNFYFEDNVHPGSVVESFGLYINDIFTEYPIVKSTILHAVKGIKPVFLMKILDQKNNCCYQVLRYLFKNKRVTEEDNHIGQVLTSLWSNFIKVGDPTPLMTTLVNTIWQPVYNSEVDNSYVGSAPTLSLSNNSIVMNSPPASVRLAFWDKIYNKFYKPYKQACL